jgi:hypothetical protein
VLANAAAAHHLPLTCRFREIPTQPPSHVATATPRSARPFSQGAEGGTYPPRTERWLSTVAKFRRHGFVRRRVTKRIRDPQERSLVTVGAATLGNGLGKPPRVLLNGRGDKKGRCCRAASGDVSAKYRADRSLGSAQTPYTAPQLWFLLRQYVYRPWRRASSSSEELVTIDHAILSRATIRAAGLGTAQVNPGSNSAIELRAQATPLSRRCDLDHNRSIRRCGQQITEIFCLQQR